MPCFPTRSAAEINPTGILREVMGDLDFSIEIHHGGKFINSGQRLEYLGGMVVEDLYFEVDEWSLQEIVSQLKQLGYKGFARVWYKEPGMDLKSGLRELKSDGDAMRMARSLVSNSCKHCEVYVVDGARESNGIHITSTDADYVPEEGEDSANDDGLLEVEVDAESEPSTEEEVFDDSADDGDHDDQFGFEVEDNDPPSNAFGGFTGPLNDERTAAAGTAEGDEGLREGDEQVGGLSDGYETDDIDSYEGDSDDMIKKRSNCGQYGHNKRLCPNPIVTAPEGTQGSDATTGTGGVDSAANEPAADDETNGSAAAATARSRMVKGRGRGRAATRMVNGRGRSPGGMARGRGRGRAAPMTAIAPRPSNTPAPTSQPPHTPAPPSQPPHTPVPPSQPTNTHAPPSQPTTLPTPASLPTTLPTPASLSTAPASQPLPKTKIFGVRRSGRLKIGVRKPTNQPPEHVDLTLD
ncbi:hypothetical protein Ahy_B03g062232 [Arachis hypogaea]|uniref:PB1-like domain-containing protein n=1 Tax=Arachis hypogaea TaxID=3818 RepID=A0A444ZTL0_ARAHY|nr:hypothetical protein Ahy_B03g062232 [Arachis hypogaea]